MLRVPSVLSIFCCYSRLGVWIVQITLIIQFRIYFPARPYFVSERNSAIVFKLCKQMALGVDYIAFVLRLFSLEIRFVDFLKIYHYKVIK